MACKFTVPLAWAPTTPFCWYFHYKFQYLHKSLGPRQAVFSMIRSSCKWISVPEHSIQLGTNRLNPQFLRYLKTSTDLLQVQSCRLCWLRRAYQLWMWAEGNVSTQATNAQVQLSWLKNRDIFNSFGKFRIYKKTTAFVTSSQALFPRRKSILTSSSQQPCQNDTSTLQKSPNLNFGSNLLCIRLSLLHGCS